MSFGGPQASARVVEALVVLLQHRAMALPHLVPLQRQVVQQLHAQQRRRKNRTAFSDQVGLSCLRRRPVAANIGTMPCLEN